MKFSFVTTILIALCISFSVSAQNTSKDELDAVATLFGVQKRAAVKELVQITKSDSAAFWKVYASYEEEMKKYRSLSLGVYERLVRSYSSMDAATADKIAKDLFELRGSQEKVMMLYYDKMKTATNSILAIQFYQAETYILTLARANIMQQVPTYGQVLKQAAH